MMSDMGVIFIRITACTYQYVSNKAVVAAFEVVLSCYFSPHLESWREVNDFWANNRVREKDPVDEDRASIHTSKFIFSFDSWSL